MSHLMANNSASILVTLTAWWIVFMRGMLWMCMCVINVATLFLMLALVAMMAIEKDEEDSKIILLSNCAHDLSFFSLLNTLKKIQSEKLSITLRPGENSESKELKDGKHS